MGTGLSRLTEEKQLIVSLLIGNLILYENCEPEYYMQLAIKPTRICMKNCNIIYIPLTYVYTIYVSYVYTIYVSFF